MSSRALIFVIWLIYVVFTPSMFSWKHVGRVQVLVLFTFDVGFRGSICGAATGSLGFDLADSRLCSCLSRLLVVCFGVELVRGFGEVFLSALSMVSVEVIL
jgi:hypothetical protein